MESDVRVLPLVERPEIGQVVDVDEVQGRPEKAEVAAAFAALLLQLSSSINARRGRERIARNRVLIPEVRVGDVLDAAGSVRPRLLAVAAGLCGKGAERLNAAQVTLRSRANGRR